MHNFVSKLSGTFEEEIVSAQRRIFLKNIISGVLRKLWDGKLFH